MVLFFTLSGFLITTALLQEPRVRAFLVRRFLRVVPLAWLYFLIALVVSDGSVQEWLAHFFFYGNLPPRFTGPCSRCTCGACAWKCSSMSPPRCWWRRCARGLWLLPLLGLLFTGLRIWHGVFASDISYYRIDEILA
ncbi:hypothetical protein LP420_06865 [Massilia sp. B-10]|nr:hypothetical protein LP420_06865 [Massilia sp. B-10]